MRHGPSAFFAILGALLLSCATASAQAPKRVALVIGNAEYRHVGGLPSADSDAAALADSLGRLGFDVKRLYNADLAAMRGALDEFQRNAADAEAALVFFAGHAVRQRGAGRLVPVDAALQDGAGVERDTLPVDQVTGALAKARNGFFLVDGCADGRLAERLQWAGGTVEGLGQPASRPGMLTAIASAQERACASRPFVDTLLVEIEAPGLDAGRLFGRTQQLTALRSHGGQEAAVAASLAGPFVFARDDLPAAAFRRLGVDPAVEAMRGHVGKFGNDPLTPVVKAELTEKEALQARAGGRDATRAWNGLIDDSWNRTRLEKARASRSEAIEARWAREAEAARQGPKDQQMALLTPPPMPPPAPPVIVPPQAPVVTAPPAPPPTPPAPPPVVAAPPAPPPPVTKPTPAPPAVVTAPPVLTPTPAPTPVPPPPPEPKVVTPAPPPTPPVAVPAPSPPPVVAAKPTPPPAAKLEEALPAPPVLPPPPDSTKMASPPEPPHEVVVEKVAPPPPAKPEEPKVAPAVPPQATPAPPAPAPAAPPEPKMANLAPPPPTPPAPLAPPPPAPAFNPDSVESIQAAQQELRRLGCYTGGVDGVTGPQTKNALAAAGGKLGPGSGVSPLTEQGLRSLRDYKGVLCAPAVAVKAVPVQPAAPALAPAPAPASPPPPPPTPVVSNPEPPPPAPAPAAPAAPAPAAPEKKKIHISM